jgi:hypothetical protein
MGGQQASLCRNFTGHVKQVEQGSMNMTQSIKHQVEGSIMQEKEWTRAFGQCNSWSTRERKSWRRNDRVGRKSRRGEARGHLGRSAQAGRPASPTKGTPRLPSSAGKHPSPSVCVLRFSFQNHHRHSQHS